MIRAIFLAVALISASPALAETTMDFSTVHATRQTMRKVMDEQPPKKAKLWADSITYLIESYRVGNMPELDGMIYFDRVIHGMTVDEVIEHAEFRRRTKGN